MSARISVVKGIGAHLPQRVMRNSEFEAALDTSDAWIVERTGIRQRHIAAEGEVTSDLGAKAALNALGNAQMTPDDIDLIVVGTTTPDDTMPSTAAHVQRKIGVGKGGALDVNAACAGFVYAVTVADSLLLSGVAQRALVIGAETYSRILDWNDRSTCILFGDGAGALVLEAEERRGESPRGVLACRLHADGRLAPILNTTGGVSSTKTAGVLTMTGREVFRHAVAKMSDCVLEGLAAAGLAREELGLLVPHQANMRILSSVAQKLGLPESHVVATVAEHANTSAASIPLALAAAARENRLGSGKIVALSALGAGLTWGSCIIRW